MDKYLELYEFNKQLDDLYINKYVDITEKMYEKNCLELIVEISELANECRCFKYWSIKTPNKELVLEEYADCMLMCLYFFNEYNIGDIEYIDIDENKDILACFNELIRMCTLLMDKSNVTDKLLLEIFGSLINLGKMLCLSEEEILRACYSKIEKNKERLKSDY